MKILGFIITRPPLYTLEEIHQFREDLKADEQKLEAAIRNGGDNEVQELENIIHVAREVLLRHLENM